MTLNIYLKKWMPHAVKASWAVAEQMIGPLLQIALIPFLHSILGVEQFGLWSLIMAVVAMGQLTSLGAGAATVKHVSAHLAHADRQAAILTIRTAITFVLAGAAIILLISVPFIPAVAGKFFGKMGDQQIVARCLFIGLALMVIYELDNVLSSAMRGAQQFSISARIEIISRVILTVGVALIAYIYKSLLALLIGFALLSFLKLLYKAYFVSRYFEASCVKPCFNVQYFKKIAAFGKWQWLLGFGGILFLVIDRLLIGSLFGAADLARYSICLQLVQLVHTIPSSGMQVVFPLISARMQKSQSAVRDMNLRRYSLYLGLICLVAPAILYGVIPDILSLWMGEAFSIQNVQLCRLLVIVYGLLAFNIPIHYFLMGIGEIKTVSISNLAAGMACSLGSLAMVSSGLFWFAAAKLVFGPIIFTNFFKLGKLHEHQR